MKSCAFAMAALLSLALSWTAAAEPSTYEEMKEALRAKNLSYTSLSADFAMDMSMQGMALTSTGEIQGGGGAMVMTMEMTMPGMPEAMGMKMVMDRDGMMWIESNAGGMQQAMKIDMGKMMALVEESGMDLPFNSSMSDFLEQMMDPVAYLEQSEAFLDFTLAGTETVNGDATYVLDAKVKAAGFQQFDPTGMLGQMGGAFGGYKMYLGVDDGFMRRMEMGAQGMEMTQTYSNVKLNPDLPASLFVYTPPAGVQVMDLTEMLEAQMGAMGSGDGTNGKFHPGDTDMPDVLGVDLEGKEVRISDYRGKVVLIDFWATWCPPCVEEMPNVIGTYRDLHDQGFEILGVSLDHAVADLTAYLGDNPAMTWVQVCEEKGWESDIAQAFGVNAVPHTLLLDKTGAVAAADLRGNFLREKIVELLAQ